MQITYYRHKKGVLRMHSRDMEYIVGLLKNGKDAEAILSVRRKLNMAFLARTTDLSGKLPVLAFGSTFKKNGDGIQLRRYNGYVLLEVNGLESQNEAEAVRREAAALPQTLLAFVGLSGRSVKIVVPFVLPDGSLPKKEEQARMFHAAAYQLAVRHYQPQLGSIISLKEPFLSRGCRMSVDPDAYYNPEALSLQVKLPPAPSAKPGRPKGRKAKPGRYTATAGKAAEVSGKRLEDEGIRYEPGHHNEYVMRTGYLFNLYGVPEAEAVAWAIEAFADYGAENVESTFRSCYAGEEEHGSVRLPRSAGGKGRREADEANKPAEVEAIEAFLLSQAEFRHNVITHHCEIRWTEEAGFLPLTDRDVNTLWGRMNKTVGRVYLTDIYNVIHSEFVPLFNPFQSYFDHLPSWDGVSDPIGDLADTVHVKSDQAEFRDYFRKWFVGILPALLDDTVVNHEILVLIGEQGLYKTTWFNFLLPPELRCYFYTKTNSDRLNKDDLFSLTEFALICFEELDGMRPAELNQLKAMVTMPYVNERAAYGRNKERHPHIASFCGTGNNVQFLTDPTGNRRWLPFEVSQIRDPHQHAIPYELVYSQAYALWKSGFCHWFSQEEIRVLNMHNSRFEVPNLEEDLIRTHFRKPFEGEAGIFVTAADILEQISSCLRYPLSPNKIGRIMAGLEFESIRYKGKRGYITVKKTGEDIDRERRSCALGL
jgi:hypothetical protein